MPNKIEKVINNCNINECVYMPELLYYSNHISFKRLHSRKKDEKGNGLNLINSLYNTRTKVNYVSSNENTKYYIEIISV